MDCGRVTTSTIRLSRGISPKFEKSGGEVSISSRIHSIKLFKKFSKKNLELSIIFRILHKNKNIMRIKVIYKKNLKMSEGKVAAQVSHAVKNLGLTPIDCDIIVLKVSDKKFDELILEKDCYIQTDKGLTEVESGTQTAAAWIEMI